jgi:ribonuclease D
MEETNNKEIFQTYVTPEEVNALPLTSWEGDIVVVSDPKKVAEAVEEITDHTAVGFDTETRPTFKKGQFYHVSLMQIGIPEKVFLFRINQTGLTTALTDFLSNERILKLGVGLHDDVIALQKLKPFNPAGFVELHNYVAEIGVRNTGLRKLAAILLSIRISKSQQTSNWDNNRLTPNQLRYAATDAWVCLEMYNKLVEVGLA